MSVGEVSWAAHAAERAAKVRGWVLISDPDERGAFACAAFLRGAGWRVETAGCPLRFGRSSDASLTGIVLELAPDGTPRMELLRDVRKRWGSARIVVATAYPSVSVAASAVRVGADDYLAKPVSPAELARALDGSADASSPCAGLPSLGRVEWEYIHRVLTHTGGNISESARILGVERSTLQRRLRKLPPRR